MDDLERQRKLRLERDAVLSTQNCPTCLNPMEPAEADTNLSGSVSNAG